MRILVTGGAGFIGSAVIRQYVAETRHVVVNVDKLTYAGNLESLADARHDPQHKFENVDICDFREIERVFREYCPDRVLHLAAESHVDRSIAGPAEFIQTNVNGTYVMLEGARHFWSKLSTTQRRDFRFLHVSTDEVFGDLGPEDAPFNENSPYAPSSPYAASKASSDHLVRAWMRTYGLPAVITNCSNNFGPYQFPEKLIPLMITRAIDELPLPVYARGENIRDWIYVEDHARALRYILDRGEVGETYNLGGRSERTNLEVVCSICRLLDELAPRASGSYEELITFVADRPGHDYRYAIDDSLVRSTLGWKPGENFESGLRKTVEWYLDHAEWVSRVRSGEYRDGKGPESNVRGIIE